MFSHTKESTISAAPTVAPLSPESSPEQSSDESDDSTQSDLMEELNAQNNNNDWYSQSYNTEVYVNERQGMSDTRFTENYQNSNNYEYENEGQGMSDTRYLNGGKYYYDVYSENNYQPSLKDNVFNTMEGRV